MLRLNFFDCIKFCVKILKLCLLVEDDRTQMSSRFDQFLLTGTDRCSMSFLVFTLLLQPNTIPQLQTSVMRKAFQMFTSLCFVRLLVATHQANCAGLMKTKRSGRQVQSQQRTRWRMVGLNSPASCFWWQDPPSLSTPVQSTMPVATEWTQLQ